MKPFWQSTIFWMAMVNLVIAIATGTETFIRESDVPMTEVWQSVLSIAIMVRRWGAQVALCLSKKE